MSRGRRARSMALATALVSSGLGAVALGAVAPAGPALAVPAGSEYPATWTVSGNVATGTTPSGVVVTATLTGPATFTPPGSLVFTGSTPGYFPATTTQALHMNIAECVGPSCGSITYTFSRPVLTPVLYIGDIGAGSVDAGIFTDFHDAPVTLTSGTFSLDSAVSQTPNTSIQNGGTTVALTNPAAALGTSGVNPSSCGTFGCGVYDISTPTQTVTSVTMDYGYAGTGTGGDIFSQILGITPLAPALTLQKSATPSVATNAGTTVTFSYLVTNTGNATLTSVHPTDTAFSGTGTPSSITCPSTTLTPGQDMTCIESYALTQADVNAGQVTNTATATGTATGLPPVTSAPSTATVTIPASPAIAIRKSASPTSLGRAGDTVHYHYLVTNTGNEALTGVKVNDMLPGLSAISCPSATLTPGQDETCTASYTVTQADVNAGKVTNTATATGTAPGGQSVTSSPSRVTVTIPASPALVIKKSASPGTFDKAGTTIHYSYLLVNTGNVTLTGVKVNDMLPGLSAISCPSATLTPGQDETCTASYVTTEADLKAGSIANTATVTGDPPSGQPVVYGPSTALVVAPTAPIQDDTPVPVTG